MVALRTNKNCVFSDRFFVFAVSLLMSVLAMVQSWRKQAQKTKKQLYVAVLISCFVLHFVMIAPRTKGSSQMNCVFSDQEFAVSPSMFT